MLNRVEEADVRQVLEKVLLLVALGAGRLLDVARCKPERCGKSSVDRRRWLGIGTERCARHATALRIRPSDPIVESCGSQL